MPVAMKVSSILKYPARIFDSAVLCKHDCHVLTALPINQSNTAHGKQRQLIPAVISCACHFVLTQGEVTPRLLSHACTFLASAEPNTSGRHKKPPLIAENAKPKKKKPERHIVQQYRKRGNDMPAAVPGRMNITRDFYQGHRSRAMHRLPFNSHPCFHLVVLLSHPLLLQSISCSPTSGEKLWGTEASSSDWIFSVPSTKCEQPGPEGCFQASCNLTGDLFKQLDKRQWTKAL